MRAGLLQAIEVRRHVAAAAEIVVACALVATAGGAVAAESTIKVCKDANGKPVAADKTDPRCFKAPLTPDEQAAVDERKRRENDAYRACKIEQRDLQTLLSRYPNKEKHDAARRAALAELESSMAASQTRMEQLLKERKRLLEEAEFYPKGNLPAEAAARHRYQQRADRSTDSGHRKPEGRRQRRRTRSTTSSSSS